MIVNWNRLDHIAVEDDFEEGLADRIKRFNEQADGITAERLRLDELGRELQGIAPMSVDENTVKAVQSYRLAVLKVLQRESNLWNEVYTIDSEARQRWRVLRDQAKQKYDEIKERVRKALTRIGYDIPDVAEDSSQYLPRQGEFGLQMLRRHKDVIAAAVALEALEAKCTPLESHLHRDARRAQAALEKLLTVVNAAVLGTVTFLNPTEPTLAACFTHSDERAGWRRGAGIPVPAPAAAAVGASSVQPARQSVGGASGASGRPSGSAIFSE